MRADDSADASQPDTWNGVPIPPRPPLPPLPDEGTVTPPPGPSQDTSGQQVTRPPFIGLPPGMQADIDTVPSNTGGTAISEAPVPQPDDTVADIDLEFPDGSRVSVDGSILVGRDPSPQAEFPDARTAPIVDVTRSMSKTHAAVQWSRGSVWVTDLHSTNGTRIVDASGRETVCVPGAPTAAPRDGGILFGRALASLRARESDGSA